MKIPGRNARVPTLNLASLALLAALEDLAPWVAVLPGVEVAAHHHFDLPSAAAVVQVKTAVQATSSGL